MIPDSNLFLLNITDRVYQIPLTKPFKDILSMARAKKFVLAAVITLLLYSCKDTQSKKEEKPTSHYYSVNASKLHIREYENVKAKSLGFVNNKEVVKRLGDYGIDAIIDGKEGEWIYIQTSKGIRGFVFSAFLQNLTIAESKKITFASDQYEFNDSHALYIYKFDPKIITLNELKKLSVYNPRHPNYCSSKTVYIELCIKEDDRYSDCHLKKLSNPNFLKNAMINLSDYQHEINTYSEIIPPDYLKEISEACKEESEFQLYLANSILEFLKSNDINYLRKKFKVFDPEKQATEILSAIETEEDKNRIFELVTHNWHNAMNSIYHENKKLPDDEMVWSNFLKEKSVKSEIIWLVDTE
ncbi:hypothetical protein EHS11_03195 [Leptospira ilyithenensis]|uniref:SH3 domain-containing protein n=1 Tax=Leptospira ilyithenensis TaxID=2484901 RepID=A0A4R9LRW2_9LEPT|nr:hypothetical protein EHS11_03195 [Leptospira ilyithenensis]